MQRMSALHSAYQESESPLVTPIRAVTSTIGSWFDENEVAQVTRMMRGLDPNFSREMFERELREYIVPEVVDAYLSADRESLTRWCSEAVSTLGVSSVWVADPLPLRTDIQRTVGNDGAVPSSGTHQ
jgi:hypothetical protein